MTWMSRLLWMISDVEESVFGFKVNKQEPFLTNHYHYQNTTESLTLTKMKVKTQNLIQNINKKTIK